MKNTDKLIEIMKKANNNDSLEIAEECLSEAKDIIGTGEDHFDIINLLTTGRDQIIKINEQELEIKNQKLIISKNNEKIKNLEKQFQDK